MICKICSQNCIQLFKTLVLNKYDVQYYRCQDCYFIQTEDPYWLNEAYDNAITKLDIGLIQRNQIFSEMTSQALAKSFDADSRFLDYGGGYGIFVRMMRDKGFDFYRQDKYCKNLFAEYFDINDLQNDNQKFELLTAFEVFEHLQHPLEEIEKMLTYSESILFSTELQPSWASINVDNWWYFVPETGQHISLYHRKTLEKIASHFNLKLYSNDHNLHLFTKRTLKQSPFVTNNMAEKNSKSLFNRVIRRLIRSKNQQVIPKRRESLLMKDFHYIKSLSNK